MHFWYLVFEGTSDNSFIWEFFGVDLGVACQLIPIFISSNFCCGLVLVRVPQSFGLAFELILFCGIHQWYWLGYFVYIY